MKNIAFSVHSSKLSVVLEFSAHFETDEVVLFFSGCSFFIGPLHYKTNNNEGDTK